MESRAWQLTEVPSLFLKPSPMSPPQILMWSYPFHQNSFCLMLYWCIWIMGSWTLKKSDLYENAYTHWQTRRELFSLWMQEQVIRNSEIQGNLNKGYFGRIPINKSLRARKFHNPSNICYNQWPYWNFWLMTLSRLLCQQLRIITIIITTQHHAPLNALTVT